MKNAINKIIIKTLVKNLIKSIQMNMVDLEINKRYEVSNRIRSTLALEIYTIIHKVADSDYTALINHGFITREEPDRGKIKLLKMTETAVNLLTTAIEYRNYNEYLEELVEIFISLKEDFGMAFDYMPTSTLMVMMMADKDEMKLSEVFNEIMLELPNDFAEFIKDQLKLADQLEYNNLTEAVKYCLSPVLEDKAA